jgi:hypothetical protein
MVIVNIANSNTDVSIGVPLPFKVNPLRSEMTEPDIEMGIWRPYSVVRRHSSFQLKGKCWER